MQLGPVDPEVSDLSVVAVALLEELGDLALSASTAATVADHIDVTITGTDRVQQAQFSSWNSAAVESLTRGRWVRRMCTSQDYAGGMTIQSV
ncbi:MAG: hypothetical protein M0008_05110 [Actinomycetota bacterium]|nr:hypothetical protein [Actinomycetota bacterium]